MCPVLYMTFSTFSYLLDFWGWVIKGHGASSVYWHFFQLPWSYHTVKKSKPNDEAMCWCSNWQSSLSLVAFKSSSLETQNRWRWFQKISVHFESLSAISVSPPKALASFPTEFPHLSHRREKWFEWLFSEFSQIWHKASTILDTQERNQFITYIQMDASGHWDLIQSWNPNLEKLEEVGTRFSWCVLPKFLAHGICEHSDRGILLYL